MNQNGSGLEMQRTASAPLPNVLTALEKEAICSRVKAAARSVHEANNGGHVSRENGSQNMPDKIQLNFSGAQAASGSPSQGAVANDSEDSGSVTDSVASCGTSGGLEAESAGISNATSKMTMAAS